MDSSSTIEDSNSPDLKFLCVYAFDTLISELTHKQIPNCFPNSLKNKKFPLFVTWTTGKNKNLRGCIGTFLSDDLEKNLNNFSLVAALKDRRFSPISAKEIPHLNVGVSLLYNFEDINLPFSNAKSLSRKVFFISYFAFCIGVSLKIIEL